jgi:hypothetical protein
VERSLRDAAVETISEDLRFIAAYNALLASATAALRAAGYRTRAQGGHHVLYVRDFAVHDRSGRRVHPEIKGFRDTKRKGYL